MSTVLEAYTLGNGVGITGTITDSSGALADPSSLTLTVRHPDGTEDVYTYPPTGIITQVSVGQYLGAVLPDAEGVWLYRWVSSSPDSATEGSFIVASRFTDGPAGLPATYTYDLDTDIGKVRMNIDDRDLSSVALTTPINQRSAVFSDEEITSALSDATVAGDVNVATARLLMVLANNRNLLVQSRRIGRTQVDYGAIRADLLRQAQSFIDLSERTPADGYAEIFYDDFSGRQIVWNRLLRDNF